MECMRILFSELSSNCLANPTTLAKKMQMNIDTRKMPP
jgi:hypothetical protein